MWSVTVGGSLKFLQVSLKGGTRGGRGDRRRDIRKKVSVIGPTTGIGKQKFWGSF